MYFIGVIFRFCGQAQPPLFSKVKQVCHSGIELISPSGLGNVRSPHLRRSRPLPCTAAKGHEYLLPPPG
jgi:hypothetical protein